MVVTLPAVIGGSIFLIVGNLPIPAWTNFIKPYSWMLNQAVSGSFGIISLLAVIGISYQLARKVEVDAISSVGLSVMAFIICSFNAKHELNYDNLGSNGIFTSILTAFIATLIFAFFVKKNIIIKLPEGVPTAVSNSFVALLPGITVLGLFWLVRVVLNVDINQVIQTIFHPLVFALNSLPGILVYTFMVSLLWVCGIHGDMTLEGISDPIFLQF